MKLALIGMSGSGKSYWSKKLEQMGFRRFCCDDLIEAKLERELKGLGYSGIQDVAKWMGQPFEEQYPRTSQLYVDFEKEVMGEVMRIVERANDKENIVIDTTGSVIYTGREILYTLSSLAKIVYLDTPVSVKQEMYTLYMQDPKPVIWGNIFVKSPEETNSQALAACYPKLLEYRTKEYEKIADITFNYQRLHEEKYTINSFIEAIQS